MLLLTLGGTADQHLWRAPALSLGYAKIATCPEKRGFVVFFLASRGDPELAAAAFARGASPTVCGGQSVVLGKPLRATFSPFCWNRFAELVFVVSFNFYLVLLNIVDGFGYNDRV